MYPPKLLPLDNVQLVAKNYRIKWVSKKKLEKAKIEMSASLVTEYLI